MVPVLLFLLYQEQELTYQTTLSFVCLSFLKVYLLKIIRDIRRYFSYHQYVSHNNRIPSFGTFSPCTIPFETLSLSTRLDFPEHHHWEQLTLPPHPLLTSFRVHLLFLSWSCRGVNKFFNFNIDFWRCVFWGPWFQKYQFNMVWKSFIYFG